MAFEFTPKSAYTSPIQPLLVDAYVFAPVRKSANAFSITIAQIDPLAPGWAYANPPNGPEENALETRTKVGLLFDMNCTVYVPSPISTADCTSTCGFCPANAASDDRK